MNEELQAKLVEALTATMETLSSTKDFALEQAPEVLQQALVWYGTYYFTLFILGVGVLYGVYRHLKYQFVTSKESRPNLYWGREGNPEVLHMFSILHTLTIIITLNELINLQWLQIWLAPKLWLLEWVKSLA